MTVILEGYIKVPLEELEAIKSHLGEHIRNTLKEHGCLEFNKMVLMNVSSMFLRSLRIVMHLMHIKKESKLVIGVLSRKM